MFFSNYLYICKKTISITMAKQHYKFIILVFLVILGQSMSFAQERIPMKLEKSGIYTIPCEVNGLKLSFVFDTGASVVHISLLEAAFMLKNGYINENDFIGTGNYIMADGSIAENALINLKSIKIGNIVIKDVTACVSSNINASLLLGQSAIQKLGKYAIDGNYLVLYSGDYPDIDDDNRLNNQYKLWSALLEDYEMGAFEDFKRDVADDYKRRKLYFAIIDDYDLPDYETFSSQLGFDNINESISLERKIALAKERLGNLYRIFKEDGYKLATRIEYQNKLKDSATATRFYNNMTEDGYELGTLNDFLNLISLAYFSSQRDDSSFESDAQERSFSHNVDYYLAQVSSQVNLRDHFKYICKHSWIALILAFFGIPLVTSVVKAICNQFFWEFLYNSGILIITLTILILYVIILLFYILPVGIFGLMRLQEDRTPEKKPLRKLLQNLIVIITSEK